jgi:hypothetical protein
MTELLDKFRDLCITSVILPDSKEITLNRLNVDFQAKLHSHFINIPREVANIDNIFILEYIKFVNKYIIELHSERKFTHRDKLFLLDFWKKDVESSDTSSNLLEDLKCVDKLNEIKLELQLSNMRPIIQFRQPTLEDENKILTFLLSDDDKEKTDMDIVFFDIFRFLHSINIDSHEYLIDNLSIEELHKLFLLFDVQCLQKISKTVTDTLDNINTIRLLEADYSSFY